FFYRYFINDLGTRKLVFWNSQTVLPSGEILASPETTGFAKLANGFYAWRKQQDRGGVSIALIPVKWDFFITNTYLRNGFAMGRDIERNYDISLHAIGSQVKSLHGKSLFHIIEKANSVIPKNNMVAVWLRILAAIAVLLFLHLLANTTRSVKGLGWGVLVLAGSIIVLRAISYFFPFPLNFRQFELFDPTIYGSNVVFRSLGDLLINSLLFAWVILFIHYHLQDIKIDTGKPSGARRWLYLGVSLAVMLVAAYIGGDIIRSLVADSQISFDVINFFTLNIYSVTGFIVLCCIAMGYFLLSQVLLFFIRPCFERRSVIPFLALTVCGLVYLSFQLGKDYAAFRLFTLAWLLLYLFLLYTANLGLSIRKVASLRLIFWLFFFSVTITAVIVVENSKKELVSRKHYA
ncbi:MAG TPA: hypothetical protein PKG65_16650, partial [Ferruginibacter sp.]|nr:hypothetical protein [Ferruginibacter sp.]